MKDTKIKIQMGYEKLTHEDVNKGKDFNKLFKNYSAMKNHWFKNPKKFGGIASAVLVTVVITVTVIEYKHIAPVPPKKPTIVAKTNSAHVTRKPATLKRFINPPFKNADIAYKTFMVSAEKGGQLNYGKTKINIPKGSFVYKNGNPVSGKVVIKYREFHTPVDFFLSGIPMNYDSAGKKYVFASAGMLDIHGFKNGQPVYISPGKKIDVQMASLSKGTNYNTYILDTIQRKWVYMEKSRMKLSPAPAKQAPAFAKPAPGDTSSSVPPIVTHKGQSMKDTLAVIKKGESALENNPPLKPQKLNPAQYSFDINADPNDFPELAVYKNMLFQVDASEKSFNPRYMSETWSYASLKRKKTGTYSFSVIRGTESHTFIVHPVFSGKNYDAAMKQFDKKYAEYQKALVAKNAEEQKYEAKLKKEQEAYIAQQEAYEAQVKKEQAAYQSELKAEEKAQMRDNLSYAVTNFFTLQNFGVYNCDCPHNLPHGAKLNAFYTDNLYHSLNNPTIYLIEKGDNSLYEYYGGSPLSFNPGESNFIWCVTPDNKLAVFTPDDFAKIQKRHGDYTFVMQLVNKDMKSEDDIKDVFKSML